MTKWVNDWAKWRATDSDGRSFEYDHEPEMSDGIWMAFMGDLDLVGEGLDGIGWRGSKEEREETK